MISDVSGIDSRLQNDSLARLKAIADAKVNKDERVAIEIFECDSCSYGYNFRGRTETRKFYDSDGFLIAMHFCYGDGTFDRIEKFYFDEFRNEIRHEYLDQKTGHSEANGKIRKGKSWIFWRSRNADTSYFELDDSINKLEPDEYTNSKLKKSVRNKVDANGRVTERIETTYLESDTVMSRSQSYNKFDPNRKAYDVDSIFKHTDKDELIIKYSYDGNGNLVKESKVKQNKLITKKVNYIIDGATMTVISEKIESEIIDTTKFVNIKDLSYRDEGVVIQRDSAGSNFRGLFSWQVSETRKQFRKHKIVKEESRTIYPDSNSIQGQTTYRYDRFGNMIFSKSRRIGKNNVYEIRRWKYTRDTLLIKAMAFHKYFNEKTQKNTSCKEFHLVNKYSSSGKLIYSMNVNHMVLDRIGMNGSGSRLPLKERARIRETERFYYPDSIVEIKKDYGVKKKYIGKTETIFSEKTGLIKSEEVDVIHNDRYVEEKIVVNENKYMITGKLNGVLLNRNTCEVLRYP